MNSFGLKDSGERQNYPSGMRRDIQDEKVDYSLVFDGPLLDRFAEHLTKGAKKYGRRNWQLACSEEELERFKQSAVRHFRQWIRGDVDEDHFSATVFNLNAAEYVKEKLSQITLPKLVEGGTYFVRVIGTREDGLPWYSSRIGEVFQTTYDAYDGGVFRVRSIGWIELNHAEVVQSV